MARSTIGPIKLGFGHYVFLAVTLLVVLPLIVWLAVPGSIYSLYLKEVVAPRLQSPRGTPKTGH